MKQKCEGGAAPKEIGNSQSMEWVMESETGHGFALLGMSLERAPKIRELGFFHVYPNILRFLEKPLGSEKGWNEEGNGGFFLLSFPFPFPPFFFPFFFSIFPFSLFSQLILVLAQIKIII